MTSVEDSLTNLVLGIFKEGQGFEEPMAGEVREAYANNRISVALESRHGMFIDISNCQQRLTSSTLKQSTVPVLMPDGPDNNRFMFSFSPRQWEVITCWLVNNEPFYTTIFLTEPDKAPQRLRNGLLKVVCLVNDCCRKVLTDFARRLVEPDGLRDLNAPHCQETAVLKRVTGFSNKVNCAVLMDYDGFVLDAKGNSGGMENVASALALFHQRCVLELGRMGSVRVRSEMFSCNGNTVMIGRIERTNLALAIATRGEHSRQLASFLYESACSAFKNIAEKTGMLWGAVIERGHAATRVRDSWFRCAQLAPQDKFVGKKGGKTFHLSSCRSLLKSEDQFLTWYGKRVDALRAGLLPCKSCKP